MKRVQIYTDGACSGNPGPGGWGVVLLYGEHSKELSGFEPETTNNRMELQAAIEGLSVLKEACQVQLYSDSSYLVNAFEKGWLDNWQRKNWQTANKQPVLNQDLWQTLLQYTKKHAVEFIKVKGHSDNPYNNRCDELATGAIKQARASGEGEN